MTSERRARSDMEHEALLRLEASERASCAERAQKEAQEAREGVELEAESLRAQVPYVYDPTGESCQLFVVGCLWFMRACSTGCRIGSSLILIGSYPPWLAAGNGSGAASGQGLGTRQASGQCGKISEGRGRKQGNMSIALF